MHTLFHTAPLDAQAWVRVVAIGLCVYAAVGVEKWLRLRSASIPRQTLTRRSGSS
jgi:hypothetical protein